MLFDFDGVIVDSRAAVSACINHALVVQGREPVPAESLHRFIGPPLASAFAQLTAEPPESAAVAACIASYRERYRSSSLTETEVVSGIPELLSRLASGGQRLAVATSKPLAFTEPLLETLGLRGFFEAVAGPSLDALGEPKSATIAQALGQLGADHAVMIGDRSFDIDGARENGLPAIGVTWGIGSREELEAAGAAAVVTSPAELPAAIRLLSRFSRYAPRAARRR